MANWTNWSFSGSASAQSDNAETCSNDENGENVVTLPQSITLTDVVLDGTKSQNHQFRFYVNGRQVGGNFYSAQINPASDGRMSWADLRIVIPQGSTLGLRTGQKDGSSAETGKVLLKYQVV
jgi:hypothetical protein